MKPDMENTRYVAPSERIHFKCKGCGACCKHVAHTVPIESLDAFLITKHLIGKDPDIHCIDDFLEKYTQIELLDECGFFVFMLKSQGPEDSCIFLKDNRCTIHSAKPRACRLYPFIASVADNGSFEYLLSEERNHHFTGNTVTVKHWMNRYFSTEAREALMIDFYTVPKISRLLNRIPEANAPAALQLFWQYRYSMYDLEKPFAEQYAVNMEKLMQALRKLTIDG